MITREIYVSALSGPTTSVYRCDHEEQEREQIWTLLYTEFHRPAGYDRSVFKIRTLLGGLCLCALNVDSVDELLDLVKKQPIEEPIDVIR